MRNYSYLPATGTLASPTLGGNMQGTARNPKGPRMPPARDPYAMTPEASAIAAGRDTGQRGYTDPQASTGHQPGTAGAKVDAPNASLDPNFWAQVFGMLNQSYSYNQPQQQQQNQQPSPWYGYGSPWGGGGGIGGGIGAPGFGAGPAGGYGYGGPSNNIWY